MSLYVEILMRADIDRLWTYTQTPDLHARWDLRFSTIDYLPRPDMSQPQQFHYSTRIGFGAKISGTGEAVGSRDDEGCRTSALKFWSEDPRSLIRAGSGYWQYAPVAEGVRFLTEYNYQTRFGWPGRWFDRLVFRPLLGWATAWSFDRLRLWLESDIDPAAALGRSLIYAVVRLTLAFIWIYQGLVPKLLFRDPSELAMLQRARLFSGHEPTMLTLFGVWEIVFGCLLVARWHSRLLLHFTIMALTVLGVGALCAWPHVFIEAFNPLSLNLAMIALSAVGLLSAHDLPTARTCRRRRRESPS